jgi:transposase
VCTLVIDYCWNNPIITNTTIFDVSNNQLDLPKYLPTNILKLANIDTFLTGRCLKCLITQVTGILKASTDKQKRRIYQYNKLKQDGYTKKQQSQLIKKIKQNIPQKPNCSNINMELNSICCKFYPLNKNNNEFNEFDGFLRLTSVTKNKMNICIPINMTRHSNKFKNSGKMMSSFLVSSKKVDIRWDIPTTLRTTGSIVGADQGLLDVLTLSDKQVTTKTDIHGHTQKSILEKVCRKKKGSNAFRRAKQHQINFVNWSINQLNMDNIKQVNLEDIWNINYKKNSSSMLKHWQNTIIRDKLMSVCELLGVRVIKQISTYRSQRCSGCGQVRKANRKGKTYTCHNCGLEIDADYNASINLSMELPEIPWNLRKLNLNRNGFYWTTDGLFSDNTYLTKLSDGCLQSPSPKKLKLIQG